MNENNTKTAASRLRALYPWGGLSDAINALIDRVEKTDKENNELRAAIMEAKEKAYDFDKRYCDLLVENRKLKNSLKEKINPTYLGYPVDPENPENCKVNLEEMEK